MKKNFIKSIFALTLLLASVTSFLSCEKPDDRDNFVGSYRTDLKYIISGTEYTGTYTMTITKSSTNKSDIIMDNISSLQESARATVNGNAILIPQQTIANLGISGSGTLNGNVLTFSTMETETGGLPINVNHTATKQ